MQHTDGVTYSVSASDGGGNQIIYLEFSSAGGMNDDAVLSLVSTLRNFAWPPAMGPVGVSATRNAYTNDLAQFGINTNPPAFS